MTSLFRSKTYAIGATRRLGSLHIHLDCSTSHDLEPQLIRVALACEKVGWPTKVTRITTARPGKHLRNPEFANVYAEHTPELSAGKDTFTAYLTSLLAERPASVAEISAIHREVRAFFKQELRWLAGQNAVVEMERVSAICDTDSIHFAKPATIGVSNPDTMSPFEVHHFIDFPVGARVNFDDWVHCCDEQKVSVGGWFQFDKTNSTSLRSVRFANTINAFDLVTETRAVNRAAELIHAGAKIQAVVEQVVDIWRV